MKAPLRLSALLLCLIGTSSATEPLERIVEVVELSEAIAEVLPCELRPQEGRAVVRAYFDYRTCVTKKSHQVKRYTWPNDYLFKQPADQPIPGSEREEHRLLQPRSKEFSVPVARDSWENTAEFALKSCEETRSDFLARVESTGCVL